MIRVAHESPLAIMPEVRAVTDYCYALVHLFEDPEIGKEYYDYFEKSLVMGREVILDNSIFELGEAFNMDKFFDWVQKLQPTYYIVPDVLEDTDGTVRNLKEWFKKYGDSCSELQSIGVVQGKTVAEIIYCYKEVSRHCDKIAISFNYSLYEELCPHQDKLYSWMYGRQHVLDILIDAGIIDYTKPHHLLGLALPQELNYYKNPSNNIGRYDFIDTMDSSNPVVHGILGYRYLPYGLPTKQSQKLFEMIQYKPTSEQFQLVMENIRQFKKFSE